LAAVTDALYEEIAPGRVRAGELTRGPWSPDAQHGGAPAALLMRTFERTGGAEDGRSAEAPPLPLARVSYELLRPVPLAELDVSASVVRPGRRIQLLEGSIRDPAGVEVVRARALRIAAAPVDAGAPAEMPPGPGDGAPNDFDRPGGRMFPTDAMEIRFARGSFMGRGPSTAWFRLRVPVFPGETPSPLQRLAAAADFPNGIATELDWERWIFINPDLTIHIERPPVGEWICLEASMRVARDGVGQAEAVLRDERGRVGRSLQSLYVTRR
jgi:hypothetical protein